MSSQLQFENDTGTYHCDGSGRLNSIEPRSANLLYRAPFGPWRFGMGSRGETYEEYRVKDLIIPEGVRCIGNGDPDSYSFERAFCDAIVMGRLRFPSTLESLGNGVLSSCLIADMELPGTVRYIGSGAIMQCYIQRLRIGAGLPAPEPEGKLVCGGRQFKETIIGTLVVPEGYPYRRLMPEARIDQLVTY